MENESFQSGSYIDSEEKARIGADKENKIRDLSEGVQLTKDQKNVIAEVAEKHAEKAMQEHDIEKEKNPVEKLINRLNDVVLKMKEMGLEQDTEIASRIQARIDRYVEAFKKYKGEYETRNNRRLSVENFLKNFNDPYTRHFAQFDKGIPVTHQIDQDGGWLYSSSGIPAGGWFKEYSQIEEHKQELAERRQEVLNYSFSGEGATEFCKSMGVLTNDQEFIDIPTIYEEISKSRVNPLKYEAEFPTNIDGVILKIKHGLGPDNLDEKSMSLKFDDDFLKKLLEN